jgi:hypothetical protein
MFERPSYPTETSLRIPLLERAGGLYRSGSLPGRFATPPSFSGVLTRRHVLRQSCTAEGWMGGMGMACGWHDNHDAAQQGSTRLRRGGVQASRS